MSNEELGVIATIKKFLDEIGIKPFTHAEIHEVLVKKFPDRDPHPMMSTVKAAVPSKLRKQGYAFRKDGKEFIVVSPPKA